MGFFGGVFKIAGGFLAAPSKRRGASLLRQAKKVEQQQKFMTALKQRRTFIKNARRAQAEALVPAAASGASLESSRVQANRESFATQELVGVREHQDAVIAQATIDRDVAKAKRMFDQAAQIQSDVEAIGAIGDAVTAGQQGGFG